MNNANKIISYFCVMGVGKLLTPLNAELQKQRVLTSLQIQLMQMPEEFPIKDNEKWIDLTGARQVWLRATFDQKEKAPITQIQILELQYIDELVVKQFENIIREYPYRMIYNLVRLSQNLNNPMLNLKYVDQQCRKGYQLVMCYSVQSQLNYDQPITDLVVIKADKIDKKKYPQTNSEMKLIIPKEYQALNMGFGTNIKNRFLIYKQIKLNNYYFESSPFKIAYTPYITDRYPLEDLYDQPLLHMLPMIPMFCFPKGVYLTKGPEDPIQKGQTIFNFILTSETGKRTYCTCLTFYEQIPKELIPQLGHISLDNHQFICYQKAICFLSPYNYPEQIKELAKYVYRSSLSKNSTPIEAIICDIVNRVKFPKQSRNFQNVLLKYILPSQDILFYTNQKYPSCSNDSLNCLFQLLDINRIISLYQAILLEKKIHLISNHISVPGRIIDAFLQLLFPFEFTSILIPVLPDNLRNYIEAPVPFMIGYSQKNMGELNQHTQNDCIYVYLDTNYVLNLENITQIAEKYQKRLKSKLKPYSHLFNDEYSKLYLSRVDHAYHIFHDSVYFDPEDAEIINFDGIRNAFLEFNLNFMKGYQKYLNPNKNEQEGDFTDLFRVHDFLEYHNSNKEGTFLHQFVETRLFQYFIQERSKQQGQKEYQHQYFDKCYQIKSKNKDATLIPIEQANKTYIQRMHEEENNQQNIFRYERFPTLNSNLLKQYEQQEYDDYLVEENEPKRESGSKSGSNLQLEQQQLQDSTQG